MKCLLLFLGMAAMTLNTLTKPDLPDLISITKKFVLSRYSDTILDNELLPALRAVKNAIQEKDPKEDALAVNMLNVISLTVQYDGPDIAEIVADTFFERPDLLEKTAKKVPKKNRKETFYILNYGWNLAKERLQQDPQLTPRIDAFDKLIKEVAPSP